MTPGTKLVTSFLRYGLIPLGIVAFVSCNTADKGRGTIHERRSSALEKNAYSRLTTMREVKKQHIETYFLILCFTPVRKFCICWGLGDSRKETRNG